MGAFTEQLEGIEQDDGAPTEPEQDDAIAAADVDPFSMEYDLEDWKVDAETTDHVLTLLVAASNLI